MIDFHVYSDEQIENEELRNGFFLRAGEGKNSDKVSKRQESTSQSCFEAFLSKNVFFQ